MNRWTYYSPLVFGALVVLALNEPLRAGMEGWQSGLQWALITIVAVVFGVQCQVLMVGAQGAFAQVLPVTGGRSIRGGGAVVAGWLLIAWFWLALVAALLLAERVNLAGVVVGGSALAALGGALIVYAWNLPAAVQDFYADRLGRE